MERLKINFYNFSDSELNDEAICLISLTTMWCCFFFFFVIKNPQWRLLRTTKDTYFSRGD